MAERVRPYSNLLPSKPQVMHSGPSVEYDRGLENPSVPYSVNINPNGIVDLLRDFRMPDADVAKLKIVVKRKGSAGASYNGGGTYFGPVSENPDKIITVYTDWVWDEYQKLMGKAEKISQGAEKPKDQFKEFLVTKRLPVYLTQAPQERALQFADKLLQRATQRKLNSALLHEAKHALDDSEYELWRRPLHEEILAFGIPQLAFNVAYYELAGPQLADKPFYIYLAGLIGGMYATSKLTGVVLGKLGIRLNAAERAADKFAQTYENNQHYRSIVSIKPREAQG